MNGPRNLEKEICKITEAEVDDWQEKKHKQEEETFDAEDEDTGED